MGRQSDRQTVRQGVNHTMDPVGVSAPNQVQRGIYLYQRVAGSVYVRYRETTKKVVGVSRLVNDEFLDAGITDLINALEVVRHSHESKDRK